MHEGLVLYQTRLVIPRTQRKDILRRLHLAHQGIERTKRRARQTVYWPGINSDIINVIGSCTKCQERHASLPAEKIKADKPPCRPFQESAADLFEHAGHFYLVYTDRYSGWPEISKFSKCPNSEMIITQLRKHFVQFGVPNKLRSDGGLQFASDMTKNFMRNWGVNHVFSAPHFPSSNGLAESAVKSMKALVAKTTTNGDITSETFLQGLLEFRNTPRDNTLSPAEMIFGSPLRSCVPTHSMVFAKKWTDLANRTDEAAPNKTACELKPLYVGDKCWIQDPISRKWSSVGNIVQARYRNYTIKLPSGRIIWRNRRHIRPYLTVDSEQTTEPPIPDEIATLPNRLARQRYRPKSNDV